MKFAIAFATHTAFSEPTLLRHLAVTAERCGFESFWSVEHVAIPVKHMPYPGTKDGRMPGGDDIPIPDPFIPLAYVAAVTKTIKLATGVMILPQRHPLYTAKEVATLDRLSGGRVILGIGSGWMKEEFDSLGIDFHRRGALTDEAIRALRLLWQPGATSFAGKFFKFDPLYSYPKPVNGTVPIHIGGNSPAAARRAGRYGDGYLPGLVDLQTLKELYGIVRSEAQKAGRDVAAIELSYLTHSVNLEDVKKLADLGVSRMMVTPQGDTLDTVSDSLQKFQQEVISRV
jgi:probable F420-dependent oxidoreductase